MKIVILLELGKRLGQECKVLSEESLRLQPPKPNKTSSIGTKKYFAEFLGTFVLVFMGCGGAVFSSLMGITLTSALLGVFFAFGLSVLAYSMLSPLEIRIIFWLWLVWVKTPSQMPPLEDLT